MDRRVRKDAKIKTARRMRKALTKPELWLWLRLKARADIGIVFRSQHPLGLYILDFYCASARLCVEVDGIDHTMYTQSARDEVRDRWLDERGIYTHRIIARDLLANPDETADGVIRLALERAAKTPPTIASDGPPSP